MRKLFMLCIHSIKIVFSNKNRLKLSISGLTIGIVIYILGMVGIDSVTYSLYKQYINFDKETIIVDGDINTEIANNTNRNLNNYKGSIYSQPIYGSLFKGSENSNIIINASIYGATPGVCNVPLIDISDSGNVYKTKIVEGRDLNSQDIKNKNRVLLISELTSKLVFGHESAIDKDIVISININGELKDEVFKVIGVYKDTESESRQLNRMLEINKDNSEDMLIPINILLVAPISTINQIDKTTTENYSKLVYKFNENNFKKSFYKIETLYEQVDPNISVYSYYKHMDEIKKANTNIELILGIIIGIIIIISGLNIMNTMFFSIKERIPEIGIKKTMGASEEDIVIQFVIESIVVSIIAAFLASAICVVLMLGLDYFYKYLLNKDIVIIFKYNVVISAILYSIVQAVVFSLIPAIKASKYKVVEALHHD